MALTLDDKLVVGISSRALFDLEEENRIFDQEGFRYEVVRQDVLP